jgi:hypothetical protein
MGSRRGHGMDTAEDDELEVGEERRDEEQRKNVVSFWLAIYGKAVAIQLQEAAAYEFCGKNISQAWRKRNSP